MIKKYFMSFKFKDVIKIYGWGFKASAGSTKKFVNLRFESGDGKRRAC